MREQEQELDDAAKGDSFDAYKEEHNRLETLRNESESLWEDRTYQMAAGGLSLTFAIFSFLMSGENAKSFAWPMAFIWFGYAFCLVVNYLSQRCAAKHFVKLQEELYNDRSKGLEYSEQRQIKRDEKYDKSVNFFNILTEIVLVLDIVFTVIYTCYLFIY
jgi:hypothetical protein